MLNDLPVIGPTQYERNWASLAHLTALLTLIVGASTSGVGAVVALLVPLGMYLYFGGRSRYVAFHALQATVFQALGPFCTCSWAARRRPPLPSPG